MIGSIVLFLIALLVFTATGSRLMYLFSTHMKLQDEIAIAADEIDHAQESYDNDTAAKELVAIRLSADLADTFDARGGDTREYRKRLAEYQEKVFPLLRRGMVDDISVVYGDNFDTIDVISPLFSSPQVAYGYYDVVEDLYGWLRFKRVNLKATGDGEPILYFDLDPPADGERI